MNEEPISYTRRIAGLVLMILGALLAARIIRLCSLHWSQHYGEESRNRMVLWFWFSWAAVAAGYALAFRSRTARWLALLFFLFAFIALLTYQSVFDPPIVPY